MIGTLEIYQGYINDGSVEIDQEPIFKESNMIVDGGKESVVDILTRIPSPTAIDSQTSSTYDISNFTIQGLSIAPNESAFPKFNALACASGYVLDLTGNMSYPAGSQAGGGQLGGEVIWSSLDPQDGNAWAYMPDIPNYEFTAVNSGFSGANYINGQLINATFSSVQNLLYNGTFKEYSLDTELSSAAANNILHLYDLSRWDIQSCLRYYNELTEFSDGLWCGSLARESIKDMSKPPLSGLIEEGYATSDDGVLFIRSFAASDALDGSGAVILRQIFTPANASGVFNVRQKDDATLSVIAEIAAKYHCVSGGYGAGFFVKLANETARESYNFSATSDFSRNEWGGPGSPLWIPIQKDLSSTLSHFVNIPNTMVNDRLSLEFSFVADEDPGFLAHTYFWDVGVNVMDGWCYGHVCEYDTLQRVYNGDYTNKQLFLKSTGRPDVTKTMGELPLSSITYFSQLFKMAPLKLYTPNIWGECLGGYGNPQTFNASMNDPPGGPLLGVSVIKKITSNYKEHGKWNYLTKAKGGNPSQWTRHLPDSGHALNPNDPPFAYGTTRCKQAKNAGFPISSIEYMAGSWIPACSGGANSLVETCLDADAAWHYLIPKLSPPNSAGYRVKNHLYIDLPVINPKPSDLCVQVSPKVRTFQTSVARTSTQTSFAVTGEFGITNTANGVFKGKVLKNLYLNRNKNKSMCSTEMATTPATDFYFVMRTSDVGADGLPRYFNFNNGGWSTTLSNQTKFFTSSITSTNEWEKFESVPINTTLLSGVVQYRQSACQTSGWIPSTYMGNEPWEKGWYGYSLIISAVNEDGIVDNTNGFFKELRVEAEAKSYAQDVPECYDWTTTGDGTTFSNNWRVLDGATKGFEDSQYGFSDVTVFPYVEYYNATGLSELPLECVGQMCYASGTIHSPETEYQFVVACSQQNNALSGGTGIQAIRAVTLNDNTTVAVPVEISGDFFTSESYVNAPRFDIVGYPHVQQFGKTVVSSGDYSGNYQGVHMKSPITDDTWMISSNILGQPHNWNDNCILNDDCYVPDAQTSSLFPSTNALNIGTRKFLGYGSLPVIDLCQVFELKDIPLDTSADKLAFGFDYQFYDAGNGGEPRMMWVATAQLDNGEIIWWRDSDPSADGSTTTGWAYAEDQKAQTWGSTEDYMTKGIPQNPFATWVAQGVGGIGPTTYKRVRTRPIDLSDNRLTPTTKIRLAIREISLKQEDFISIKNWQFYRVTAKPSMESLPVFPHPIDTTVQPATSESQGELGQFTNHIHLASSLSATSLERSFADGGWAPLLTDKFDKGKGGYASFGNSIAVSGSVVSGVANKFGIVNSDGIVYKLPPGESSLSSTFINGMSSTVSSLGGGASAMLYAFDISSNDVNFFDIYGGIGGMGLWTLNGDETFRKFAEYNHSITATNTVFDMSAYPLATCLYNVTDVTRNPVFKLFSKKVFRTPLSIKNADFLRIKWYVQLV